MKLYLLMMLVSAIAAASHHRSVPIQKKPLASSSQT
jgi:hypothetical protein